MTTPRPLTDHRFARLLLWARLWLEAVARLLPAPGGLWPPLEAWMKPLIRARLNDMCRLMALLIFIRAMGRLETEALPRMCHPRGARRAGAMRAVIGSALRRALYRRDLRAQFAVLFEILRNPELAIARLVKRLRRGLRPRPTKFKTTCALLGDKHTTAPRVVFNSS